MHVCVYNYVCTYVYMYASMYICMYVCIYVHMYICMYASMYICIYVCMHLCTYVCKQAYTASYMYVCMYVHMHMQHFILFCFYHMANSCGKQTFEINNATSENLLSRNQSSSLAKSEDMPNNSELTDAAVLQTTPALCQDADALNRSAVPPPLLPVGATKPGTNYPEFIAIHDYSSEKDEDLNFKKGDLLYIVSKDEGDWWRAKTKQSDQEGYIPKSYVKRRRASKPDLNISKYPLFVAIYDYSVEEDKYLGFKKGDLLYIMNTDEGDWWFAKSKHTGQEGYIPNNFVTEYKSVDAEE